MRDHLRILGGVFIAWAAAQALAAVLTVILSQRQGGVPPPAPFWILLGVMVLAYGWVGFVLRQHAPSARIPALILSGLALLSFPVGTALGIYGLWVLLRRHEAHATP